MFYHDNGKIQVFAHTRCGNTNMHHYFNIKFGTAHGFPLSFNDDLIIVLRNPLDRVVSAIKSVPQLSLEALPKYALKKVLANEITMEFLRKHVTFGVHCKPYLYEIEPKSFRIIDFYRLSEYLPRRTDLLQSPVTNSNGYTDPKSVYVENDNFSLADLEKEYDTYLSFLKDKEQISITEWKEKTT